ncbi:WRKY transcription factor, partial [Trifolium medium]|nr:WRKY transcription factor [Trifolium medium]
MNDAISVSDEKQACPTAEDVVEQSSKTSEQDLPFRKARVSIRARSEAPL